MTFGALVNLVALIMFIAAWPIWPWSRNLSPRPAIVAGVVLTVTVLLWVTQII
ncbi:DUF3309 family protein [Aureimonas frigidaquae]|uniref:Uncharacterized protein n=1 Tax=Aureimonas frigidaquae TaxID=424757 RepID=A0A0P0Z1Y4_9HYPH|nr:DUF3309 family protein [Aureimonas frigidaquae]BAT27951.1 hypothetical protein [Aureimonas frigidaquae]